MGNSGIIIIIVIIVILLGWGIFGGVQTRSFGYTCDLGSPGSFCLMWHENPFGTVDRIANEITSDWKYGKKQSDSVINEYPEQKSSDSKSLYQRDLDRCVKEGFDTVFQELLQGCYLIESEREDKEDYCIKIYEAELGKFNCESYADYMNKITTHA